MREILNLFNFALEKFIYFKEKIDFIAKGRERELKPEDCFEIKIQK